MAIMMGHHIFDDPSFQLFQKHTCDYFVGGGDLPQVSDICYGNLMINIYLALEKGRLFKLSPTYKRRNHVKS
jgi:hypothetical protein